jgi:hypothetical protein
MEKRNRKLEKLESSSFFFVESFDFILRYFKNDYL